MSKRKRDAALQEARRHTLHHGTDVLHALGCLSCGLRTEALDLLTAMGWDEQTFMVTYFEWLLGEVPRG